MTLHEILAMPRAQAFELGVLVPVSRERRVKHQIPFPVRFTAAAWQALVAYRGERGGRPDPRTFPTRLERALTSLSYAISNVSAAVFRASAMQVALPSWVGPLYARDPLSITVITTRDQDDADVLTVMLPHETYERAA